MTAMWADAARLQVGRFERAMDRFRETEADRQFRLTFDEKGRPASWTEQRAEADQFITQRELWAVGVERYYLLLTLGQLRKCVMALPDDELPQLRESKTVRLLRDIDEHWEQDEEQGRSLREMRQWKPHLGVEPGSLMWNNKHVWIGDLALGEITAWVLDVDRSVRASAELNGDRIPEATERLPDK